MKKIVPMSRNININENKTNQELSEGVKPALKIEGTATDIGDRTAIRKLTEMLPPGK